MPPHSFTFNFDSLLTTTWMNYREKLYDNIFNAVPFFHWIYASGRKRIEDGGESIVVPLEYGRNSTIKSMETGYDTIDTTPQDPFTSAKYDWREVAGSTSISNKELAKNQGKGKIIRLLESLANNTEMSFTEIIEAMIIGAMSWGNGGADIQPLSTLVAKDPTASTEIGGINQNTYAWWRNQYKQSAATTYEGLIREIANLYNKCSKGGKKGKRSYPDMGICDQNFYETYEGACRAKGQMIIPMNEKIADMGFGGIKYRGTTLMWDEFYPDIETGTGVTPDTVDTYSYSYCGLTFLNSEFLEFVICKGQDFVVGPFIQPENQKVKTSLLYLMGELCCSNRRKQGVLFKVPTTIIA